MILHFYDLRVKLNLACNNIKYKAKFVSRRFINDTYSMQTFYANVKLS